MKKILIFILFNVIVNLVSMDKGNDFSFYNNYSKFIKTDFLKREGINFPLSNFDSIKRMFNNYFTGKNPEEKAFQYLGYYEKIKFDFSAAYIMGFDSQIDKKKGISFFYKGVIFLSEVKSKGYSVLFNASWVSGQYLGDKEYIAENAFLLNGYIKNKEVDNYISLDKLDGNITLKTNVHELEIGRDSFEIGENISSSIILNKNVPNYGYLKYEFRWKNFNLLLLHGSLVCDDSSTLSTLKDWDNRYLAVHKLSYTSNNKSFKYFLGETIVYGSRSLDLSYLLPHVFYRIVEHRQGDRDNVMIFTGWEFKYKNIKFYQNIILDELRKTEIFGNWWGNKYAIQTGVMFDLNKNNIIAGEITLIRPWLYTHKYKVNRFSHYDSPLGFEYGANLINYTLSYNVFLPYNFKFCSLIDYTRQGSVGNNYKINYNDRPSDTAHWLEGEINDYLNVQVSLQTKILNRTFIKGTTMYKKHLTYSDSYTYYLSIITNY